MQFSKLLETRPSLFPIRFPTVQHNDCVSNDCVCNDYVCTLVWQQKTTSIMSSHAKAAEPPLSRKSTQGGSEVKGHYPGHHMDQQNHNLPYGRFQSQHKQHSSPALSTPHSSWPGFWSSLQIPKQKPKRILERTCKLVLLLLNLARVSQ